MGSQLYLVDAEKEPLSELADPVLVIFDYWKTVLEKARSQLGPKRKRAIRAMLDIGYSVEEIKLACVGCKYDSWSNGSNSTGLSYDGIEFICRDETTLERYVAKGQEYMDKSKRKDDKTEHAAANPAVPMPAYVRSKLDALFSKYKR